jgi:hypothetical protein
MAALIAVPMTAQPDEKNIKIQIANNLTMVLGIC